MLVDLDYIKPMVRQAETALVDLRVKIAHHLLVRFLNVMYDFIY